MACNRWKKWNQILAKGHTSFIIPCQNWILICAWHHMHKQHTFLQDHPNIPQTQVLTCRLGIFDSFYCTILFVCAQRLGIFSVTSPIPAKLRLGMLAFLVHGRSKAVAGRPRFCITHKLTDRKQVCFQTRMLLGFGNNKANYANGTLNFMAKLRSSGFLFYRTPFGRRYQLRGSPCDDVSSWP